MPLLSAVTMVLAVSTTDCGSVGMDSNSISHPFYLEVKGGQWLPRMFAKHEPIKLGQFRILWLPHLLG